MSNRAVDIGSLNIAFPKTLETLQEKKLSYLQDQFYKTLIEQLLISKTADVSRWFPVFLKFQGIHPEILEVAEFEYLQHLVMTSDPVRVKLDPGQVHLNPSVQFLELHHRQVKLKRETGLYCFFKRKDQLVEFKLNIQQALVIDLLHEDRKYSFEQLALQSAIHEMGASQGLQNWKDTIIEMLHLGILVSAASGLSHQNHQSSAAFGNDH